MITYELIIKEVVCLSEIYVHLETDDKELLLFLEDKIMSALKEYQKINEVC